MPDTVYTGGSVDVRTSSVLYIFSDGVYEITRPDGTMWSFAEFKDHLLRSAPCGDELDALYTRVRKMVCDENLADDFSVLKVTLQGSP